MEPANPEPHNPASSPSVVTITELLARWKHGDKDAENTLMDALYPTMKLAATGAMRSMAPGKMSISATELVHETYMRLIQHRNGFVNRAHFLAIAGRTLKRVFLDLLKARATEKRGAGTDVIALEAIQDDVESNQLGPLELAEFFDTLERLRKRDAIAAEVLELRLLGGLTNDEAADVLDIGVATAGRHFAFARAWVMR